MLIVNLIMVMTAIVCAVVGILLLRSPFPMKGRAGKKGPSDREDIVQVRSAVPPEPEESAPEEMVVPLTQEELDTERKLKEKPREEGHRESGATRRTPRAGTGGDGAGGKEPSSYEDDELGGMPLQMFDE